MAGVTGPSGSGKSSLLAVAATLIAPTRGTVAINGADTSHCSAGERARLRRDHLGIVFQQANLIPSLTAVDQLLVMTHLGTTTRHSTRVAARSHALDLLDQVGLVRFADKRPAQLSGGERQRVNIARALMDAPDVLLVDEPTSDFDSGRGSQIST